MTCRNLSSLTGFFCVKMTEGTYLSGCVGCFSNRVISCRQCQGRNCKVWTSWRSLLIWALRIEWGQFFFLFKKPPILPSHWDCPGRTAEPPTWSRWPSLAHGPSQNWTIPLCAEHTNKSTSLREWGVEKNQERDYRIMDFNMPLYCSYNHWLVSTQRQMILLFSPLRFSPCQLNGGTVCLQSVWNVLAYSKYQPES